MPSEPDSIALLAQQVAGRLLGPTRGVSLIGPPDRTDAILNRLPELLDRNRLVPVAVRADSATPDALRDAAGRAHAARPSADTVLLLIVPDAGRLSTDLLRELEQAAEAALAFGGLKFLLASAAPLRPMLRKAGLIHLRDCLDDDVTVAGALRDARLPPPGERLSQARRTAARPAPSFRWARRLAGLVLVLALVLIVALFLLGRGGPALRPIDQTPIAAPPVPQPPVPERPVVPPVAPVPAVPVSPPPHAPPPPPTTVSPTAGTAPPSLPTASNLLLVAQPGDTLPVLYAKVYAGTAPPPYADVVALNPVVRPGTRLIFPPPPGGWRSKP